MVLVIPDNVFISNAFYAKQTDFLSYDEMERYRVILYQTLNEEYKYVDFNFTDKNPIEIGELVFIKLNDGIQSFYEVTRESIEYINSIYPIKIRNLIKKSRDKFDEENKEKEKSLIKKMGCD